MIKSLLQEKIMADVVASQLTRQDKREVFFYRAGIALATFCLLFAAGTLALILFVDPPKDGKFLSKFLDKRFLDKLYLGHFVNFAGAVGLSMIFMHLYARKILKSMQVVYGLGLLTFLAISSFFSTGMWVLASHGGLALVFVAFSFIAAKEAYCFKYYEGWLVGPLSAFYLVRLLPCVSLPSPLDPGESETICLDCLGCRGASSHHTQNVSSLCGRYWRQVGIRRLIRHTLFDLGRGWRHMLPLPIFPGAKVGLSPRLCF